MAQQIDTVCGVDRYQVSPTFGQLVAPVIYMWKAISAAPIAKNLSGAVAHGTQVEIVRTKEQDGKTYAFVKCDIIHNKKTYPQHGWVSAALLTNLGEQMLSV